MRLLFSIIGVNNGAIASLLRKRCNYLTGDGSDNFQIFILTEGKNNSGAVAHFNENIHFLRLDKSTLSKRRLPFLGYFTLRKEIRQSFQEIIDEVKPDVITTFNLEAFSKEAIPFVETSAKKVIEFHGAKSSFSYLRKRGILPAKSSDRIIKTIFKHPVDLFRPKENDLHNRYDFATVLTDEDFKDRSYLNIPKKRIYNFVNLPKENKPFIKRKNIILGLGRFTKGKRFEDLIKAIDLIKENLMGKWELHLYGYGSREGKYREKIKELQLEKLVKIKGYSLELEKIYNDSKLLVSTSLSEGFGLTLVEALSYKIPVIAYDCKCGPKEIIKDGTNGYLVDFKIEELAQKILELTSNPEKLQSFSDHCHDDIEKFSFENIMPQWVDFYEQVNKGATL